MFKLNFQYELFCHHLSKKNQIRKVDIQKIKQFLSFMTSPVIFISYFHLSID